MIASAPGQLPAKTGLALMAVVSPVFEDMAVVTLVVNGQKVETWDAVMPDPISAGKLAGRIVRLHQNGFSGDELMELIEREEDWVVADWRDRRDGITGIISFLWRRIRRVTSK